MKRKILESLQRIRWLIRKEFIQIVRNRQNLMMLLVAPLVQLIIFGSASRLDVNSVSTVVVDLDHSRMSRDIVEGFSRSGYFKIIRYLDSYEAVDKLL